MTRLITIGRKLLASSLVFALLANNGWIVGAAQAANGKAPAAKNTRVAEQKVAEAGKPQAGGFVDPFAEPKPDAPAAAQTPPAPPPAAPAVNKEGAVLIKNGVKIRGPGLSEQGVAGTMLKFDNADIFEVVQAIMGDILQLNYMMDPSISGKVTIHTQGAVSHADLFSILEGVLSLNNLSILRDGKMYKIVKDANAPRDSIAFEAAGEGSPVVQIIPVRFVQATALVQTLRNFIGQQAGITNDPTNKYLIVADRAKNVTKILDLVKVLDVDYLQHVKIRLIQVEKGDATEMARELETLFKTSGLFNWPGTDNNKVFFMPINRMNAVLVAASVDAVLEAAEKWIKTLDDEPKEGVGSSVHVYNIANSNALQIANILRQLYGGSPVTPSGGDTTKVVVKGNVPATSASGGGLAGSVQIIPDEATNSLIIKANPQDYLQIKKVIERIDMVPRQVLIQVMVAEVSLNDETKFGVEWFLKNQKLSVNGKSHPAQAALESGLTAPGMTATDIAGTAVMSGFNYFVFNGAKDLVGMFNALGVTTDVNVLSSPHVLASDGKEAKIEVGNDIPVVTQTTSTPTSSTGTTTSNSVQYRPTGILLSVKPSINASGLVSLKISQEVSNLGGNIVVGGQEYPQFSKRKVETDVTLEEGKTLLIAGLIQNNGNNTSRGVPYLKDVPLLGYLFGAKSDKRDKTELMITLTPYVVRGRADGDRITDAFQDTLKDLKGKIHRMDLGPDRPKQPTLPQKRKDEPSASTPSG